MLKRLFSRWHFRRSRFAHGLALERPKRSKEFHLWAHYRLGMYQSVADAGYNAKSWRGLFAKAVSLAACGRLGEARDYVKMMAECRDCRRHVPALADALAPFMPESALLLIEGIDAPAALRAALLMRIGRTAEARSVLEAAFEQGKQRYHPELLLHRSNAMPDFLPQQRLADLNAFLEAHGLPAVALKDPELPPSPVNVKPAAPFKASSGPLVTILMTTYRTGKRADTAIASVLAQSYRNIELIVVDDASGDDTPAIVRDWAKRDSRVTFIPLECNVGTYAAKNIGLRYAEGAFVTCHDSDDWSHPLKIEHQVRPLLDDPRLVATTSHWVRMQDDGVYYARQLHPLMRLNPSSPLFRRKEVLERAGAWDCVRTGADSEFLARLRLVFGKRAVKRVAQPLSLGSHRPDSLMTAGSTGYSDTGVSPQRLAYWEAWGEWHIRELHAKRTPFVPAELLAERRFDAPESIVVPSSEIEKCMNPEGEQEA
jgi:hypothetical protein